MCAEEIKERQATAALSNRMAVFEAKQEQALEEEKKQTEILLSLKQGQNKQAETQQQMVKTQQQMLEEEQKQTRLQHRTIANQEKLLAGQRQLHEQISRDAQGIRKMLADGRLPDVPKWVLVVPVNLLDLQAEKKAAGGWMARGSAYLKTLKKKSGQCGDACAKTIFFSTNISSRLVLLSRLTVSSFSPAGFKQYFRVSIMCEGRTLPHIDHTAAEKKFAALIKKEKRDPRDVTNNGGKGWQLELPGQCAVGPNSTLVSQFCFHRSVSASVCGLLFCSQVTHPPPIRPCAVQTISALSAGQWMIKLAPYMTILATVIPVVLQMVVGVKLPSLGLSGKAVVKFEAFQQARLEGRSEMHAEPRAASSALAIGLVSRSALGGVAIVQYSISPLRAIVPAAGLCGNARRGAGGEHPGDHRGHQQCGGRRQEEALQASSDREG